MKVTVLVCCWLAVLLGPPAAARAGPAGPAVWPLQPQPAVVHPFDPPGSAWGAGHRGVDLLGSPGQDVHAALAGTVTFAGTLAGRGVVVVDHGATRTTYEPVEPAVPVGTIVGTGALVGHLQVGLSHCLPRACLHWGLLRGEQYLDPLALLGRAPVRLLPLAAPPLAPPPLAPLTAMPMAPATAPVWMLRPSTLRPWGGPAGRPFAAAPP